MDRPDIHDEDALYQKLERLAAPCRAAFAGACAERVAPAYGRFATRSGRDPNALCATLDRLWAALAGDKALDDAEAEELAESCVALVPFESDAVAADDLVEGQQAVAALAYALRAWARGDPQEAVWAARVLWETMEARAVNHLGLDPAAPDAATRVRAYALVQTELRRQERDLRDLVTTTARGEIDARTLFARLRARARSESLQAAVECD